MNLGLERNAPVELSAVLERLLQLSNPLKLYNFQRVPSNLHR